MNYTNITGVNIGNCLTGFGIHFPITVLNSGNSQVLYTITNSNQTNFNITSDSFIVEPSDFASFDLFYYPTRTAVQQQESTDLIINSVSVEDGSVDPSGNITIKATGSSLINLTGGNPRSFRVIKNFSPKNGIEYDFYWKPPTGITGSNLHNYFITGYGLDFADNSNFTTPLYSKKINVPVNTNETPKYSTCYGFGDDDIFAKVGKDEISSLAFDTSYYARLYTYSVGNTGVSVYASGIDYVTQNVSNQVAIGYSGTPIDIKIEKISLDIYLNPNTYTSTFDLDAVILEKNGGSNDLSFYSGINIYFPENSSFSSADVNKAAIKLDGIYNNFTGKTTALPTNDTVINLYIPSNTKILGRAGNGGTMKFDKDAVTINAENGAYSYTASFKTIKEKITKTQQLYSNNSDPNVYDSTNGGPALGLKLKTNLSISSQTVQRTDIKYNIFSQVGSQLYAGGGGGKAGVFNAGFLLQINEFYGKEQNTQDSEYYYPANFPINGSVSPKSIYTIWDIYYRTLNPSYYKTSSAYSSFPGYGELGPTNCYYLTRNYNSYWFAQQQDNPEIVRIPTTEFTSVSAFVADFYPVNTKTDNRQPGYIIDINSDASASFHLYNNYLPADYIFRFPNSKLNSNTEWKGGSSASPEAYTMTSSNAGTRNTNFEGLGYNYLSLNSNKEIHYDFSSSVGIDSRSVDLYFVCAFSDINTALTKSNRSMKLFDWTYTNTPNNTVTNQIYVYQLGTQWTTFTPKDNKVFYFKNMPLFDQANKTEMPEPTNYTEFPVYSDFGALDIKKISKPLVTSKTYRPFILNVRRISSTYYIFLNGVLVETINALDSSGAASTSTNQLIQSLNSTTFKLINSGSFSINYFDVLFYNRILSETERLSTTNYLVDQYFSLFVGASASSLDLKSSSYSYRLPNIFNIAGKSS
jgi:hypothetical protein